MAPLAVEAKLPVEAKVDAVANSRFSFLRNLVTSLWLPNQNANVGQMGADIFA